MKKLNLSKELFYGSMLIGVLSIGLVSCGAGGIGGSSTSQPSSSSTPALNLSFGSYIYQGADYQNEPVITVYIDGQPVKLLADTGASGLVVNQTAVNIPSSDYTSYTFSTTYGGGSTISGTMVSSATVCLNPSITNTCVVMPIGVITGGNAFSSSSEAQGDIGLDSSFNTQDAGTNSSGSVLFGYSYPTYLAQEYGINSFTIEFYPLSNTFYAYVSPTTPIGEISFGTNAPSTYLPYTGLFFFPYATAVFPSYTSSISSDTQSAVFDTGSNFNFLTTDVFQTEIPNFSQSSDENNCSFTGWLNGGYSITYQVSPYSVFTYSSATAYYTTSFTTEPSSNSFCSSTVSWNLMTGNTVDAGFPSLFSFEDFGLPEMLRHTFVWVLDNNGYVQGISISP